MNAATNSMNRLTKMLLHIDDKLKGMGTEPYGQRKATAKEQQDRVQNLTSQELLAMIDQRGAESVNEWLQKYWKEDDNG